MNSILPDSDPSDLAGYMLENKITCGPETPVAHKS